VRCGGFELDEATQLYSFLIFSEWNQAISEPLILPALNLQTMPTTLTQTGPSSYTIEFEASVNQNTYGPLITSALLDQSAVIFTADRCETPNGPWSILITMQSASMDPVPCISEAIDTIVAELQQVARDIDEVSDQSTISC